MGPRQDRLALQKGYKVLERGSTGRLHSDICNVIPYLLPGVKLQIKLTKAKWVFLSNEYEKRFHY